jgi:hypothetical protein
MLAQLFNPTEIKKNGPAASPAIAPARRSDSPFTAASVVLPATAQSYGEPRGIVNGDQHRRRFVVRREFTNNAAALCGKVDAFQAQLGVTPVACLLSFEDFRR